MASTPDCWTWCTYRTWMDGLSVFGSCLWFISMGTVISFVLSRSRLNLQLHSHRCRPVTVNFLTMHDITLRRSASLHCHRTHGPRGRNRSVHRASSLDTLVIHARTGNASDQMTEHISTPSLLDFSVANALLTATREDQDSPQPFCCDDPIIHFNPSANSHLGEYQHRFNCSRYKLRHASKTSSYASRATSGMLSSDESSELEAEKSALRYNELAKRYGLGQLDSVDDRETPQRFIPVRGRG